MQTVKLSTTGLDPQWSILIFGAEDGTHDQAQPAHFMSLSHTPCGVLNMLGPWKLLGGVPLEEACHCQGEL